MTRYINLEEEFEGSVDRIFTTDVIKLNLFVVNTVELIKQSHDSPVFEVGIGGSIFGDSVIYDGVIYFGSCDKNLYAVSLDGKEKWRFGTNHVVTSPAVDGSRVYVGSFDGNFYCIDINGKLIWKYGVGDKMVSRPAIHGGAVYFGSRNGNLYALSKEGKLLWKFRTGGPIGTDPSVYNNTIYFGSRDCKEYALTLDGKLKWSFPTGGIAGSPYADEGGVYFGGFDKTLCCVDHSGKKKWVVQFNEHLAREPACYNGILYQICMDGNLYALTKEGKILWKFSTQSALFSIPCFDRENIYLGSTDNNVYCIDQKTGREKWRFACGGPIATNLAIKDGMIFAGGWDCKMYAISNKGQLVWTFPTSLSYIAPVNVETSSEKIRTFRMVWKGEEMQQADKYKERILDLDFGGYGNFTVSYRMSSDYAVSRKRYVK